MCVFKSVFRKKSECVALHVFEILNSEHQKNIRFYILFPPAIESNLLQQHFFLLLLFRKGVHCSMFPLSSQTIFNTRKSMFDTNKTSKQTKKKTLFKHRKWYNTTQLQFYCVHNMHWQHYYAPAKMVMCGSGNGDGAWTKMA